MIQKITHIELYVSNIVQATNFYKNAMGFEVAARGITTNNTDAGHEKISNILRQGSIYLILTSSPDSKSPISKQISLHGDFVKDISFEVTDIETVFNQAIYQGFTEIEKPQKAEHQGNKIVQARIGTFEDVVHTLIEKADCKDDFVLPGYPVLSNKMPNKQKVPSTPKTKVDALDHIAIAISNLGKWTEFYKNGLGFYQFYQENIDTGRSGMDSIVMNSNNDVVKFVFVAPKKGIYKSQIEKFLEYNNASGVQHLAFSSLDIISAVNHIKKHDIEFLPIPDEYYDNLPSMLKEHFKDSFSSIKKLGILVDRDSDGYLQQIFTKPLQTKPTFFLELIQRTGAHSFGKNNILALFKAVEKQLDSTN